ncbi:MAG: leucine-rich repeat protein [Oscillospiraceae bacterium]|nr:leucine-rich repeat protein [Oscillospiraceae bacterium]
MLKKGKQLIIFLKIVILAFYLSLMTGANTIDESIIYEHIDYEYIIIDNEASIVGYSGTDAVLQIPSEINGHRVTRIAPRAFYEKESIESIVIPESVSYIGESAFAFCRGLKALVLSEGLEYIGPSAFMRCVSLNYLTLPNSIVTIEEYAFAYCMNLWSVSLPENLSRIESYSFMNCGLTTLSIPDSVVSIGEEAFMDNWNLLTVIMSDNVIEIERAAFSDCRSLTDIKLSENLTTISFCAISNCRSLKSIVLPNKLKTIEANAFQQSAFLSITIPESVETIQPIAFFASSYLRSVVFYNPQTTIGERAFVLNPLYPYYFIVFGYESSTAEAFANENGLPFFVIDEYKLDPVTMIINQDFVTHGDTVVDELPKAPMLINGRTMLPFRYLVENILGDDNKPRFCHTWRYSCR